MHVNLPFADDAQFARLHAAIRLVLPLLPALAASSPIAEGSVIGSPRLPARRVLRHLRADAPRCRRRHPRNRRVTRRIRSADPRADVRRDCAARSGRRAAPRVAQFARRDSALRSQRDRDPARRRAGVSAAPIWRSRLPRSPSSSGSTRSDRRRSSNSRRMETSVLAALAARDDPRRRRRDRRQRRRTCAHWASRATRCTAGDVVARAARRLRARREARRRVVAPPLDVDPRARTAGAAASCAPTGDGPSRRKLHDVYVDTVRLPARRQDVRVTGSHADGDGNPRVARSGSRISSRASTAATKFRRRTSRCFARRVRCSHRIAATTPARWRWRRASRVRSMRAC